MSFGLNIKEGRQALPSPRRRDSSSQTNKNVSNLLRNTGIQDTSDNVETGIELALGNLGISAVSKNKDFSLLGEQTKDYKIENPNIKSSRGKRTKNLASKSFTNDQDPFFETGITKPVDELIQKANKDRQAAYTKAIPIANYLATVNNGN